VKPHCETRSCDGWPPSFSFGQRLEKPRDLARWEKSSIPGRHHDGAAVAGEQRMTSGDRVGHGHEPSTARNSSQKPVTAPFSVDSLRIALTEKLTRSMVA
jgi:hypothetical protein